MNTTMKQPALTLPINPRSKLRARLRELLGTWLILVSVIPMPLKATERNVLDEVRELKAEARKAALNETSVLIGRLRQTMQPEKPHYELNPELTGIATEIFFAISFQLEFRMRLAERGLPHGRKEPHIIAVRSRPRAGNTDLIRFISKTLTKEPSDIEHIWLSSESSILPDEVLARSKEKRILILDDFGYFYLTTQSSSRRYLLPLIHDQGGAEIVFLIDAAKAINQLDPASRSRIQTVVGAGERTSSCDQFLSSLKFTEPKPDGT